VAVSKTAALPLGYAPKIVFFAKNRKKTSRYL
jgi:hypothetical protein